MAGLRGSWHGCYTVETQYWDSRDNQIFVEFLYKWNESWLNSLGIFMSVMCMALWVEENYQWLWAHNTIMFWLMLLLTEYFLSLRSSLTNSGLSFKMAWKIVLINMAFLLTECFCRYGTFKICIMLTVYVHYTHVAYAAMSLTILSWFSLYPLPLINSSYV